VLCALKSSIAIPSSYNTQDSTATTDANGGKIGYRRRAIQLTMRLCRIMITPIPIKLRRIFTRIKYAESQERRAE